MVVGIVGIGFAQLEARAILQDGVVNQVGRYERTSMALFQRHDAATGTEGLRKILLLFSDFPEVTQQDVVYGTCTLVYLLKVLLVGAVPSGQVVRLLLRVCIGSVVTLMHRDQLQAVEDLEGVRIVDDVHTLADVLLGDTVVVPVQHHVAVLQDGDRLARLHLVADGRKRLQVVLLQFLEELTARFLPAAHPAVVKFVEGLADGLVQRRKVMEHLSIDVSIDRAVHQLHGILHESLVLRVACPGWEHGHVIVFSHWAKEQYQNVGKYANTYRYVMMPELYTALSQDKVIKEAALRSGVSRGVMQACWDAAGEVIKAWATEGHSVALPGLGTMRFGLRAKSVDDVNKVKAGLITSRRIIFTPDVDLKDELAKTAVQITCYDRDGKEVKRVTSTDEGNVEDPEQENGTTNSGNNGSTENGGNTGDNGGNSGGGGGNNTGGDDED